jgi:hypothetical protein
MKFTLTPDIFAKLLAQLRASSEFYVNAGAPQGTPGEYGTITHGNIKAGYTYAANLLTVDVTEGGGWLVNKVIKSKIQDAINAAQKA